MLLFWPFRSNLVYFDTTLNDKNTSLLIKGSKITELCQFVAAELAQTLFFGLFQDFSCIILKNGTKVLNKFARIFLIYTAIVQESGNPRQFDDAPKPELANTI